LLALLLALGLVAAACGDDSDDSSSSSSTTTTEAAAKVTGDITVSAAASLKEAFTTIAADFEAANPGTTVTINFGSSGELATQIQSGAPADVAAFASESDMTTLSDAGVVDGAPQVFATNELAIVTKPGNPKGVRSLADLDSAGIVSLCAETAPCGKYADQALSAAGVSIPPDQVTRGQDVRSTLTAVTQGDAVAGIIYVTDAAAAGAEATSVPIPADQNVVARYPIGVVTATTNPAAARAFADFVLGPQARDVLEAAGFGAP
jgi:molybdate transport system substrate-binding protein